MPSRKTIQVYHALFAVNVYLWLFYKQPRLFVWGTLNHPLIKSK